MNPVASRSQTKCAPLVFGAEKGKRISNPPCLEQQKLMGMEQAAAFGLRAGDEDRDKSLSGKFFSSPLKQCKQIVIISKEDGVFHVPFHHLDASSAVWLLVFMLQWTSERGS